MLQFCRSKLQIEKKKRKKKKEKKNWSTVIYFGTKLYIKFQ